MTAEERLTRILPYVEKRDDPLSLMRACVTPVAMFSKFARFKDDDGRLYMPRHSLTEELLGRALDPRLPEEEFYVDYYIPPVYRNAEYAKQKKDVTYIPRVVKPHHLDPGQHIILELRRRKRKARKNSTEKSQRVEVIVIAAFDGEALAYRDGEIDDDKQSFSRGLARVRVFDFPTSSLLLDDEEYYNSHMKILYV